MTSIRNTILRTSRDFLAQGPAKAHKILIYYRNPVVEV